MNYQKTTENHGPKSLRYFRQIPALVSSQAWARQWAEEAAIFSLANLQKYSMRQINACPNGGTGSGDDLVTPTTFREQESF